VPDQVPHVPPWTRVDICFESALSGCLRKELGFLSNGCDVLGDLHIVLPIDPSKGPTNPRDLEL
jgi:hypothetical protein